MGHQNNVQTFIKMNTSISKNCSVQTYNDKEVLIGIQTIPFLLLGCDCSNKHLEIILKLHGMLVVYAFLNVFPTPSLDVMTYRTFSLVLHCMSLLGSAKALPKSWLNYTVHACHLADLGHAPVDGKGFS